MRVGLQGWGSEGDLRPMLTLATRLRAQGHAPSLLLTPVDGTDYVTSCRARRIPCQLVPEALPVTLQELASDARHKNPTKLMNAVLARTFYPFLEQTYAAALSLCARSDVVVGGSSSWVLKAAAQASNVPYVSLHYYPAVPSRVIPPAIFPNWRWLARPGWALLSWLLDLALVGPARKFFAQKGLGRVRHVLSDLMFSERLNLLAASPALFSPAPDWPAIFCMTGPLRADDDTSGWQPSPALAAFLKEGEKPVLMSLGSMEHMAAARSRELLIASARHAGVRAVIQSKTATDEGRDGSLYFLAWAPHQQLAPYCSAVVHHGGAGTSHAALRAGLPSVVLPFIFEQSLWAKRLRQVGTAPEACSFWRARPARVAALIREATASVQLRTRAGELARAMLREDGAATSIQRIAALLS